MKKTNPPLIFDTSSRTSAGYGTIPAWIGSKRADAKQDFQWFFGQRAGRAWHGLLIASKIGVLNSAKDAPASKEFS
ncbi:MAG: hypothetical protein V4693_07200 [Pseudomonadota bacterium]